MIVIIGREYASAAMVTLRQKQNSKPRKPTNATDSTA
jgi:hypothetical protein